MQRDEQTNTKTKKTGVIYARVSKSSMDYERQVSDLSSHAEINNIEITKVFSQKLSATKTEQHEREQLQEALEYIEENKIDKLLIWELSRLDRKQLPLLNLIDKLNKKGVSTVILMPQPIESLTPDGNENPIAKFLFFFLSYYAEMEAEQISKRIKSKLKNNAEKGKAGGGLLLAYGYTRDKENNYVVDETEAKTVQYIYYLLLTEKLGTERIAERLNEEGIPTKSQIINKVNSKTKIKPKPWTGTSVHAILRRTDYKGVRVIKKQEYECEPVIDEVTWNLAQEQLSNNYNENSRNTRHFYLLENLIKCKVCDKNYVGKRRGDFSDNYYQCSCRQKKRFKNCGNKGVGIFDLNTVVWQYIKYNKESIQHIQSTLPTHTNDIDNLIAELDQHNSSIRKFERQIEKLLEIVINDSSTTATKLINKKIRAIEKKIEVEESLRKSKQYQLLLLKEEKDRNISAANSIDLIEKLESPFEIRQICEVTIKSIKIEVIKRGYVQLYIEFLNNSKSHLYINTHKKRYYHGIAPFHYPTIENTSPQQDGFYYGDNILSI